MNVQIVGTMLDPSGGEPAGGAMIQFIALAQYGGVPKGAQSTQTTSATGEYDFPLNYGRYSLYINHSGRFVNQAVSVTVNEDSPPIMDIDLLLESSVPLTPPEFKYLEELVAKAEQAADDAEGFASDAAYQVSLAGGEVVKATNQANIASNEADRAKSEADRATEVTGLDTVEQAVDMALAEFAGIMTESEARAINRINEAKYDASGMVNMGNHSSASSEPEVNEGLWIDPNTSNALIMGRGSSNVGGASKTNYAVTNIAGAIANIIGVASASHTQVSKFLLPEAEDGTRIYDSTGDARGSGQVSLDLKVDVDPKYGDVAADANEAVARAFEGLVKNGDFRDGVNNWDTTYTGNSAAGSNNRVQLDNDGTGSYLGINQIVNVGAGAELEYELTITSTDFDGNLIVSFNNEDNNRHDYVQSDFPLTLKGKLAPTVANAGPIRFHFALGSNKVATAVVESFTVRKATEEVVTHPVDGAFLEYWEEEQTDPNRIEVAECIQSLSTTFGDTDVPTVLSTRKLSYFQQYDGQFPEVTADPDFINDRYRCVVWGDLTNEQKRKVAAYMGEKLFVGVNGNIVNGRLRARTIRGLGNGDWLGISSASSALNGRLVFDGNMTRAKPQGALDTGAGLGDWNAPYAGWYVNMHSSDASQAESGVPPQGAFSVVGNSGLSYQGRCFMYVVATVPRANQGAYHPDLNPWGVDRFNGNTSLGSYLWHSPETLKPNTVKDCFNFVPSWSDTTTIGRLGLGGVSVGISGHPDGIFYDGIEAGGLNGVIDWRLGAVANDSPEEAAKVEAKVENSTYRGLEKLVRSKVFASEATSSHGSSSGMQLPTGHGVNIGDTLYWFGDSGALIKTLEVTGVTENTASWDAAVYTYPRVQGVTYTAVAERKTNLSVSGEFNTQMVIGDPANILLTDALKDGWLGTWCPVITTNSAETYPYSRKVLDGTRNVFTEDYGVTWTESGSWNSSFDSVDNSITRTANIDGGRVYIVWYKAFAKQTKLSTNKPVYNAKAGLLGVTVTQSYDKSVLAEAVAGVILKSDASGITTEQSSPVKFLVNEVIERITSLATDMVAPTNSSQAIKVAVYQISENGQVSLGFIANTMTHNGADWGELDEIIIPFGNFEVDTFNDDNQIPQIAYSTMTAIPMGWTSNHARAGSQVEGVDL